MVKIIKVTGTSLSPFFLPDDYTLLISCRLFYKNIKAGDTVVFDHPQYGRLIKLVSANQSDQKYLEVQGANSESISSQKLGHIPYSNLVGKVIFHFKKPRPRA